MTDRTHTPQSADRADRADTKLTHPGIVDPCTDARWDRLHAGSPGRLFTSGRWLRVLADLYGFTFQASVVEDDQGELVGALPYAVVDDLRGERIVSLPFSDVAEPIVADEVAWRRLTAPLMQLEIPVQLRTFAHPRPTADRRFLTTSDAVWHEIECRRDPDDMFTELHKKTRHAIRRAGREGYVAEASSARADLERIFELHLGVRRHRYGLLAQPFALFEMLWERYIAVGDGAIVVARKDGEVHGATFLLADDDTVYYKFAATSPEGRATSASHLCLWHSIRYAQERGARALDLGRSDTAQSGLVDFKARFNPVERKLTTHRAGNQSPPAETAGKMLGELTELLVDPRVPDDITARAGALLYRYFA